MIASDVLDRLRATVGTENAISNAPDYLAQRHNIGDQDEVFDKITVALHAFATASASSE